MNNETGYYRYNPEKSVKDLLIDTDDWGVLHLINMIENAGRDWYDNFMTPPRIGVGDMSLRNGGKWDDHSSHKNGLDVDVRYVRKDHMDTTLNIRIQPSLYDSSATLSLMRYMVDNGSVQLIILSPYAGIIGNGVIADTTGAHDNHFHVRIFDPDGTQN